MPTIFHSTTGAAAGATINATQGSQYEYLPFNAFVEFAIYADTGDTWTANVFSGSDVLMEGATLPILATATPIIYPDHYFLNDIALAGERIGVKCTNGTGGAADFRAIIRITPV